MSLAEILEFKFNTDLISRPYSCEHVSFYAQLPLFFFLSFHHHLQFVVSPSPAGPFGRPYRVSALKSNGQWGLPIGIETPHLGHHCVESGSPRTVCGTTRSMVCNRAQGMHPTIPRPTFPTAYQTQRSGMLNLTGVYRVPNFVGTPGPPNSIVALPHCVHYSMTLYAHYFL